MSALTEIYLKEESHLVGREAQLELMQIALLRTEKPNIVLVGEPGVGKTALVHHLAYMIARKLVVDDLRDYTISEVGTNNLLAGSGYRGVTEQKFKDLVLSNIRKQNQILFFDEFHTLEGLGAMSNGQTPGFSNMLKPYLTTNKLRIIGATTTDEYEKMTDRAFLRRFMRINVPAPTKEMLLEIAKRTLENSMALLIKFGSKSCGKFSKNCAERAVDLSQSTGKPNPDCLKELLDLTVARARYKKIDKIDVSFLEETFYLFYEPAVEDIGA